QEDGARSRADGLNTRINDIQERLDQRRAALIRQFVAMESAMSKAQALGAALTAQLNANQSR
ncbi:MAG TPA: hypothetical protein VE967_19935, partial [Gemmatimonadaceae bacterium]|nr:hypothetical protein [Gemmatimonadaceae bacterium]